MCDEAKCEACGATAEVEVNDWDEDPSSPDFSRVLGTRHYFCGRHAREPVTRKYVNGVLTADWTPEVRYRAEDVAAAVNAALEDAARLVAYYISDPGGLALAEAIRKLKPGGERQPGAKPG